MIIEGAISVKAAIKYQKRDIEIVYINKEKKTKDFNYIRKLLKTNNINYKEMKKEELDKMASGNTYGGIIAKVTKRRDDEFDDGDIFYLGGIEDPFNIGYCLRTLYAFGFKNILLSKRDYSSMESQLLKSSAGAYDMLNIKVAEDDYNEISALKEKGYYLYCLARDDSSKDIFDVEFKQKAIYALGGEKRGIASSILDIADEHLYIKYASDFKNSLNAAAALDVVATLIYSKRK